MAVFEDFRVFVGGLSLDTDDRGLGQAFMRFGKVVEAKVVLERNGVRSRGFGFVTFTDEQSVQKAIKGLHGRELDGKIMFVTKAQPKRSTRGVGGSGEFGYAGRYKNIGGYSQNGAGGRYKNLDGYSQGGGGGSDDCFRCGKLGHWARECPNSNSGRGGSRGVQFSPRYGYGNGSSLRGDCYGGGNPEYGEYCGNQRGGQSQEQYGRDWYGSDYYDGSGGDDTSWYERKGKRGFSTGHSGNGGVMRHEREGYRNQFGPYGRPSRRVSYNDHY